MSIQINIQVIYVPLLHTGGAWEESWWEDLGCNTHKGPVQIANFRHIIKFFSRCVQDFSWLLFFTEKLIGNLKLHFETSSAHDHDILDTSG